MKSIPPCVNHALTGAWTRNSPYWPLGNIGQNVFVTLASWFQWDIWYRGKEKISSDVTEKNRKTPDEKGFRSLEEYEWSNSSARWAALLDSRYNPKAAWGGKSIHLPSSGREGTSGTRNFSPLELGERFQLEMGEPGGVRFRKPFQQIYFLLHNHSLNFELFYYVI